MCGRFTLTLNQKDIQNYISKNFNTFIKGEGITYPHYNIAPSMDVLSVLYDGENYRAGYLTWGFKGFDKSDFNVINIRKETMYEKPMFKTSTHKRCIVLADGYYEWVDGLPKRVIRKDKEVFAIAALWNITKNKKGQIEKTVGLITQEAFSIFKDVHARMPLILKNDMIEMYLKGEDHNLTTNPKEYEYYEVSKDVNKVVNNHEKLIEEVSH